MRRSIRSVRKATSSSPSPSRHSFAPYASPTAMRTIEIGAWTPPSGITPGMRRPVRTITRPPISSRRIRFGEPTSSRPSGVIVAALSPSPCSRIARAASCTTLVAALSAASSSERSKRGNSSSSPITSGARTRSDSSSSSWPGLVAFQHHDRFDVHGSRTLAVEHAEEGGLETRGIERTLPLRRRARKRITDDGQARADQRARDPARHGRTSGSRRTRARSCRRPASTLPAGGSTCTTRTTARSRSRRSSTG